MIVSEAQMAANILNASHAKGPAPEHREITRRNGLKHGLIGKGVVTSDEHRQEIDRRIEALTADLKPMSTAGVLLIAQMANLSHRAELAAAYEMAAIAKNVRHAVDDHDEEQIEKADKLFDALADDPRNSLRKLRKSPEGLIRLTEGWQDLRADLEGDDWGVEQLEHAANLTGLKSRHAKSSRLGALTRALAGDFVSLGAGDGAGLKDEARKAWAKSALFEFIDAQIAELEEHYLTLDFETIDLDRAEAGSRALFDTSKPAMLARRYEAEARRGFFKALKEFRQVEAEFAAQAEATATASNPAGAGSRMGSSRETLPPPDRGPSRPYPDASMTEFSTPTDANGKRLVYVPSVKTPG